MFYQNIQQFRPRHTHTSVGVRENEEEGKNRKTKISILLVSITYSRLHRSQFEKPVQYQPVQNQLLVIKQPLNI